MSGVHVRIFARVLLMLSGCGHLAVVGIEPRGSEDEVEIVGPAGNRPTWCESPTFVDEPTTHYASDDRCTASEREHPR